MLSNYQKKGLRKGMILLAAILLSGCSVHKMNFDCKAQNGIGCKSLSKVNDLINENGLKKEIDDASKTKQKTCLSCQKPQAKVSDVSTPTSTSLPSANIKPGNMNAGSIEARSIADLTNKSGVSNQAISPKLANVARTQEKTMRLWFNGYYDEFDNYIGSQYVYTVIEPARWVKQ